jgi:TRAP-type C4-dicarboxylate transport system permease small subunit
LFHREDWRLLKKVSILFDRILNFSAVLACILLSFTTISVCAGIFSRYFLSRPWAWVTEVNEFIIVYITFLVAAWVLKQERHVKMEVIISSLDERVQAKINFATSIFCALGCLIIAGYAIKVTWSLYETHAFTYTVLELPKWIFYFPIFFGFLFLFFQFFRRAYGFLEVVRSSKKGE